MADLSNKPDIQSFGKALKSIRERTGMSQQALSESSGVTVKQISKLENGRAEPKYLTILAFSDALGITMNDFRSVHEQQGTETEEDRPSGFAGGDHAQP